MLYLSLSTKQTYTANQALGSYDSDLVPLRLPGFSESELEALYACSFSQVVARLLNLFFGKNVTDDAIEKCLKKNPLIPDNLDRRTLLIKFSGDREHGISELTNNIYKTMIEKQCFPGSWASTAIRISLLFGIYADMRRWGFQSFDIALASDRLQAVIPAYFAKKMGLPINTIVIGTVCEDDIWKLLYTGKLCDLRPYSGLLASFLHGYDPKEAERYVTSCDNNTCYELSADRCRELNDNVFSAVVSIDRAKELIGNVGKTFGKQISPEAAISYGALQDYRSVTGENNITLILMEDFANQNL